MTNPIGLMGKGLSEAHRLSISKSNTGKKRSEESKLKQSKAISGANNHNYGKHKSDITKDKLRHSCRKLSIERIAQVKIAYYEHKESGGSLSWNDFQKWYKENSKQDGVVGALYNAYITQKVSYNPDDVLNLSKYNSGDLDNYAEMPVDDLSLEVGFKKISLDDLEDPYRYLDVQLHV